MKTGLCIPDFVSGGWHDQVFKAFRPGVEICLLHDGSVPAEHQDSPPSPGSSDTKPSQSPDIQPTVALLRYQPEASVPRHRHAGIESILVLSGSQSDENGRYFAGTMIINPVGSIHSVWSVDGCVVLIQWDKPVEFC